MGGKGKGHEAMHDQIELEEVGFLAVLTGNPGTFGNGVVVDVGPFGCELFLILIKKEEKKRRKKEKKERTYRCEPSYLCHSSHMPRKSSTAQRRTKLASCLCPLFFPPPRDRTEQSRTACGGWWMDGKLTSHDTGIP